jgi:hypothetical protein
MVQQIFPHVGAQVSCGQNALAEFFFLRKEAFAWASMCYAFSIVWKPGDV